MNSFIALLFCTQSVEDLTFADIGSRGNSAISALRDAKQLAIEGRRDSAIRTLRAISADQNAPSRARIWAARTLTHWDARLNGSTQNVAMGVVLSIGSAKSTEIVAAYRDKSFRYVVDDKPAAIYEGGDVAVDEAVTGMIAMADYMLDAPEITNKEAEDYAITILTLTGSQSAARRSGANALLVRAARVVTALASAQCSGQKRVAHIERHLRRQDAPDSFDDPASGSKRGE